MISYFKKKNKLNLFLLFLFFILFFTSVYYERNKMLTLYESGISKIYNQEYQEAQQILGELGDYKDSLNQIEVAKNLQKQKTIYDSAIESFNREDYKNAINLFTQINDFKDSGNYIEEATKLMEQKNANEALYSEAYDYYEAKNYISAIQTFSKLNDYKDSEDIIQECRLELARLQQATTISAGIRYSTGIISNGKIKYSGDYNLLEKKLATWKNILSISLKGHFAIGLKKDGTVIVAGNIPDYPDYYIDISLWKNIIAVSSGQQYIVGLQSDGTLVAQGHNGDGQLNISDWENIVAISCGWRHTVGVDSNGDIKITGYQSKSQLDKIDERKSEWRDIVAISAAGGSSGASGSNAYTAALKQNGKVVTTLPSEIQERINNWTDIIAISAGDFHIVGLKSDGSVVIEQVDYSVDLENTIKTINNWTNIIAVSAGNGFTLGLKKDGTVEATGYTNNQQINVDSWECVTNYKKEWESIFDENLRWNGIK